MDEITKSYIFSYYYHLLTLREKTAYWTMVAEAKVAFHKEWVRKRVKDEDEADEVLALHPSDWEQWISTDQEVRALLANGRDEFIIAVCERLLREEKDKIYFNRCPRCQAVTRTPTAKQCPKCFFSWHDDKDS
jgi:hypothetical protein